MAFRQAYGQVFGSLVGSWDDVFGAPLEPRQRLAPKRKRKVLETPVWKRCRDLHAGGDAIGDELFARVAKEFRIGARQAKSMYYEIENAGGRHSSLWTLKPPS